jgi:hypothetical protein
MSSKPARMLAPLAKPKTRWVPPLTTVALAVPPASTTCEPVKIVALLAWP